MKSKLTVAQAVFLADKCESLFNRAARAWVNGNNSGNMTAMKRGDRRCAKLRKEAEQLLAPFGIIVDYPGLYPSFTVNGFEEHSTIHAISAALEKKGRVTA